MGDALDASGDASQVVVEQAFIPGVWMEGGGVQSFPGYPGASYTGLMGITANGGLIVGGANLPDLTQIAFRWTEVNGFQTFGQLEGIGHASFAQAVTPDGTRIVGHLAGGPDGRRGFLWDGQLRALPQPEGTRAGDVRMISRNGEWIVGYSEVVRRATLWTGENAFLMESVEGQSPVHNFSDAWGVSDTAAVVGTSRNQRNFDTGRAVFWLAPGAPTVLQQWLADTYGLVIPGWTLRAAYDVSANGRVITGYGDNPAGLREGWKLELPVGLAGEFQSETGTPMSVRIEGGALRMSWPAGDNMVIEAVSSLGSEWGALNIPSQIVDGREVVTVPLEGESMFFRLRRHLASRH